MSTSPHSYGQTSKVLDEGDKFFFNIFKFHPDSAVYPFVKKYFPMFIKQPQKGGWTMYPPESIPVFQMTMHSLIFNKHPYVDIKFKEGRLDFLSQETDNESPGIRDIQLWFFFDNKQEAEQGFSKLSSTFGKISTVKKIIETTGKKIAHYADQPELIGINSIELILTQDEIQEGKYKILFKLEAFDYSAKN
jgi:hypothetical protein